MVDYVYFAFSLWIVGLVMDVAFLQDVEIRLIVLVLTLIWIRVFRAKRNFINFFKGKQKTGHNQSILSHMWVPPPILIDPLPPIPPPQKNNVSKIDWVYPSSSYFFS